MKQAFTDLINRISLFQGSKGMLKQSIKYKVNKGNGPHGHNLHFLAIVLWSIVY